MTSPDPLVEPFVKCLEDLVARRDRGALAALRRGAGKTPGTVAETHRYVAWAAGRQKTRRRADCFYVVASLFALWHQGAEKPGRGEGSFGRSLRELVAREPKGKEGVERRLAAMLAAHGEDLPVHLRHAVALLKGKDVPVDWRRLLEDLAWWDGDRRLVQRRWAEDFWAEAESPAEPAPAQG